MAVPYKTRPVTPTRVECCGPHGKEHLIVSMVTARAERWIVFPKESIFNLERRAYLGWCRRCQETYEVVE
jgi:hypothetical protein